MNAVKQPFGEINIYVDDSRLEAYIYINYSVKGNNAYDDAIASQKYTASDILKALGDKGIVYGIIYENLDEAAKGNKKVLIAKGTAPQNPIDDRIEYYFPVSQERRVSEVDGRVDFLDNGPIFFVKEGVLLAKVIEGKDGTPGKDVFGEIILCPQRKHERLKKGPNCEYTKDHMGVVSEISGMPCLKNGTVAVFDTYSLNGDVDCKTGNIVFDGNVLINGNVKEGMKVSSQGFITVTQNVDDSELKADGNITVMKNLICSVIRAGASEVPDKTALMHLKEINSFFISLKNALDAVISSSSFSKSNNNMPAIIRAVLQFKFKNIDDTINIASAYFKSSKADSNLTRLFEESLKLYKLMKSGLLTSTELIVEQAVKNNDYIAAYESIFSSSDAIVSNSLNSTIYATNDVVIIGNGCYNTNIFANNNVRFTGYPGIFRGGSISAGKNVSVGEIGSEAEVQTVIRTSREGIITAEKVYPNVFIYFGNMAYKVENPYKHFKAYVKEMEIFIEKQRL